VIEFGGLDLGRPTLSRTSIDPACAAGRRIANRLTSGVADAVRYCPVRVEFIRKSSDPEIWWSPPAMHMLRGGRGGSVRLKLYLSMLWLAVKPPHVVKDPAYHWAVLLGLSDDEGLGKRRVQDAVHWLVANQYLARVSQPGRAPLLTVLHDSGSAEAYKSPVIPSATGVPTYRRLAPEFWTNGWIAALGGASLVVWLAFLDEQGKSEEPGWLSPSQTRNRYGISDDTRKKGLAELKSFGLITPKRGWHREPFHHDFPVIRYRLNHQALDHRPDQ
jgi:hypothetical protein